jgi:hypothetical protein
VTRFLIIATVTLYATVLQAAVAPRSNEAILRSLDAAEQRWAKFAPRNYSYTVTFGTAFGSTSQYRVTVRDGGCSAKRRIKNLTRYSFWKAVESCEGVTMTHLFSKVRAYGNRPNVEVLGFFDDDFGAVMTILTIDDDLPDESAQIEVTRFRIYERP